MPSFPKRSYAVIKTATNNKAEANEEPAITITSFLDETPSTIMFP
jgi:hypothetical protein